MLMNYFFENYCNNHPMNIYEDEDGNTYLEFRAVGLEKEDIEINYESGILEIKSKEKKSDTTKYLRQEFQGDRFNTRLELPADTDSEKIEAVIEKGILRIKLGKDKSKNKKIEIL